MLKTYLVRHTDSPIFIQSVQPFNVTTDLKQAYHFATRTEAKQVANQYGFKVVTYTPSKITQAEFERLDAIKVEIWD